MIDEIVHYSITASISLIRAATHSHDGGSSHRFHPRRLSRAFASQICLLI